MQLKQRPSQARKELFTRLGLMLARCIYLNSDRASVRATATCHYTAPRFDMENSNKTLITIFACQLGQIACELGICLPNGNLLANWEFACEMGLFVLANWDLTMHFLKLRFKN